jgi:hypothetical protein
MSKNLSDKKNKIKVSIVTVRDGNSEIIYYDYKMKSNSEKPMALDVLLQAQETSIPDLAFRIRLHLIIIIDYFTISISYCYNTYLDFIFFIRQIFTHAKNFLKLFESHLNISTLTINILIICYT